MKTFLLLTKRNFKLFFKDKAMFFTSLITPVILLVLYVTFLQKVFRQSFEQFMPPTTPASLVRGTVGAQLLSSLLAVCCVTVAFCSNMLLVSDKVTGARRDLDVSPVKQSTLALSYYVASVACTLLVCAVALAGGCIYIAAVGWYIRFGDFMLILLDTILLVLFGTALSSVIHFFLSSQGQISAVGTIVCAGYGFVCGAYMPLSQFSKGLATVMGFLPGTYATSLIRNHCFAGAFAEMESIGYPPETLKSIRDSVDCNLYMFGHQVPQWTSWLVIIGATVLLVGVYVLQNVLRARKHARTPLQPQPKK